MKLKFREYLDELSSDWLVCTSRKNKPRVNVAVCNKCPKKEDCDDYKKYMKKNVKERK